MGNAVRTVLRGGSTGIALVVTAVISLSACSSGSHSPASSPSTKPTTSTTAPGGTSSGGSSGSVDTAVVANTGITVTGAFNTTPTVVFPAGGPPKRLEEQTVVAGQGATVTSGDTLVLNYLGEIWPVATGAKPKVFDSSYSRHAPDGFVIGTGAVIPGFDKTLVGQKLGSRLVLSIPPADGYGPSGNSQAGIAGTDTLVFVVDLLADYKPNASAPGVAAAPLPATGWPHITNPPGQPPQITGVAGVQAPTAPTSKLLLDGLGANIDPTKTLVLQLVQTDIATGKQTQSTWGHQPQLISAQTVLSVATALNGQKVGARAVVLLPASPAQPATATAPAAPAAPPEVLILDVVGQF